MIFAITLMTSGMGDDDDEELLIYLDILIEFVKEKKDFRDMIAEVK